MRKFVKKTIVFALAVGSLSSFYGCKKGENDPFFSFKTRKARITGEWILSEGTTTNKTVGLSANPVDTLVTIFVFDGTNKLFSSGSSLAYTETFDIRKDGTFELEVKEGTNLKMIKGNWYFAGKSPDGDLKNKEAIVLSYTEVSNSNQNASASGLDATRILLIDRLKNKEVVFKGTTSAYQSNTGVTIINDYNKTFVKQ